MSGWLKILEVIVYVFLSGLAYVAIGVVFESAIITGRLLTTGIGIGITVAMVQFFRRKQIATIARAFVWVWLAFAFIVILAGHIFFFSVESGFGFKNSVPDHQCNGKRLLLLDEQVFDGSAYYLCLGLPKLKAQ